jgi:hypothetical protein
MKENNNMDLIGKYLNEDNVNEADEMSVALKHLSWIAGAFNTALNTQKQYETVKNNSETRKKLKEIFSFLKKNNAVAKG